MVVVLIIFILLFFFVILSLLRLLTLAFIHNHSRSLNNFINTTYIEKRKRNRLIETPWPRSSPLKAHLEAHPRRPSLTPSPPPAASACGAVMIEVLQGWQGEGFYWRPFLWIIIVLLCISFFYYFFPRTAPLSWELGENIVILLIVLILMYKLFFLSFFFSVWCAMHISCLWTLYIHRIHEQTSS